MTSENGRIKSFIRIGTTAGTEYYYIIIIEPTGEIIRQCVYNITMRYDNIMCHDRNEIALLSQSYTERRTHIIFYIRR